MTHHAINQENLIRWQSQFGADDWGDIGVKLMRSNPSEAWRVVSIAGKVLGSQRHKALETAFFNLFSSVENSNMPGSERRGFQRAGKRFVNDLIVRHPDSWHLIISDYLFYKERTFSEIFGILNFIDRVTPDNEDRLPLFFEILPRLMERIANSPENESWGAYHYFLEMGSRSGCDMSSTQCLDACNKVCQCCDEAVAQKLREALIQK